MGQTMVGVIGGTGLGDALGGLGSGEARVIETPFGATSGPITLTEVGGVPVALLARHGEGHVHNPSSVPYRANIWALKSLGVTHVLASGAVGSLREEIAPRHLVIPDQIIDRTFRRAASFFDELAVHVELAAPFCGAVRNTLVKAGTGFPVRVHQGGTYVCMEGPQFSSLAESLSYKAQGYSVIGMTNMPEAKLAREAEISYASVAMVTDFDCWHPDHDAVTVQDIIRVLTSNADRAKALVARLARDFPREHEPCPIGSDRALDTALITAPEARDPDLLKKLDAVAGRILRA